MIGGKHQGYGTHNSLLGLGHHTYLEIIAPDPDQNKVSANWIPADRVKSPQLIGWAIATNQIDEVTHEFGRWFGDVVALSRLKPDGSLLQWKMTLPRFDLYNGFIPFLIDWGSTAHPSSVLPKAGTIENLLLFHPKASEIQLIFEQIGINQKVGLSQTPRIEVEINQNGHLIRL